MGSGVGMDNSCRLLSPLSFYLQHLGEGAGVTRLLVLGLNVYKRRKEEREKGRHAGRQEGSARMRCVCVYVCMWRGGGIQSKP